MSIFGIPVYFFMHTNFNLIKHLKDELIFIDNSNEGDCIIYKGLYDTFKNIISNGHLHSNSKLPSTRSLSNELGFSRSTIVKVYNLLVLEDYILSKSGSGYYVSTTHLFESEKEVKKSAPPFSLSAKGKKILSLYNSSFILPYEGTPFRPGLPPLDVFPISIWKKLTNDWWKYVKTSDISFCKPLGASPLKKIIASEILPSRGVFCDPEQVVIVSGTTHALMLISQLMLDDGDIVLTEDPVYINARNLFKANGGNVISIDMDSEGISIDKVKKDISPKLIYVTPSNQYPSGVKMSRKRREELIEWGVKKDAFIIEDDYDWEYSNRINPINSLYGINNGERVLYLGTFNKVLHPAIRLGYMVIPKEFIDAFKALQIVSFRFLPLSRQLILYEFIKKGYFSQHIGNLLRVSNERKEFFIKTFSKNFKKEIDLFCPNNSLNLIIKLPSHIDDMMIVKELRKKGIIASPYSSNFINRAKEKGLIIGYASTNRQQMVKKIKVIVEVLKKVL